MPAAGGGRQRQWGVAELGEDDSIGVRVELDEAEKMEHSKRVPCGQRAWAPPAQAPANGGWRRGEENREEGEEWRAGEDRDAFGEVIPDVVMSSGHRGVPQIGRAHV